MLRTLRLAANRLRNAIFGHARSRYSEELSDDEWFRETDSGVTIGERTAYSYGPWFRAISLISSCVAKTNLDLWQDQSGKWIKARKHPAYQLLCGHGKPNSETLRYHFFQTLTAHAVGHGGGFAYVLRDKFGRPEEIIQLRPDRTYPIRENGRLLFITSIGGDYGAAGAESRKLLAENVLHIHGLGYDGLTGYSLTDLAARSLGCAIAKEKFGAKFFSNSATPGVVIKTPRKLSDTAMKHLKESWQTLRTGLDQAHKPIILEDEADAVPFTHSASDSQLVESMMWDPVMVSNFTGVPAFMLGAKGYNSNSTLETQSQNLLDFTVDPWFVPWEQECNDKLLTEDEKRSESLYFEFARKDLIRVDSEKKANVNKAALGGHPWMQVAEVREEDGLDKLPDTDFIPQPLNMGNGDGQADNSDEVAKLKQQIEDLKNQNSQSGEASKKIFDDTVGRMRRRLETTRSRRSDVTAQQLLEEHGTVLRDALGPVCLLVGREVEQLTRELCEAAERGSDET